MSRMLSMDDDLLAYFRSISVRESSVLQRLREETARLPEGDWQISPEEGQFLAFLVELIGARRVLEVGRFTDYSALSMALALPEEGLLVTCDMSEEYTVIAKRYWAEAGVAEKIDLRLAPAVDTVDALVDEGQVESFDFVFIDCNKKDYDTYYERALQLVRTGGPSLSITFFGMVPCWMRPTSRNRPAPSAPLTTDPRRPTCQHRDYSHEGRADVVP